MKPAMKNINPPGFFDDHFLLEKLTKLGHPLQKLSQCIDFAVFRPVLITSFSQDEAPKAGRPAFDRLMLFKALIIQSLYNLSDDQLEFQINDRASFKGTSNNSFREAR